MIACMSSTRPTTPNSATDSCAEITNSIPDRRDNTNRSPDTRWQAPPGPNTASYDETDTAPVRPSRAAPPPAHTSGVSPRDT